MTLAQLIHKIVTDPEFASAFRAAPQLKLAAVGVQLEEGEASALLRALEGQQEQGRSLSERDEWPSWWADLFQGD
jgi:hypothetical protein